MSAIHLDTEYIEATNGRCVARCPLPDDVRVSSPCLVVPEILKLKGFLRIERRGDFWQVNKDYLFERKYDVANYPHVQDTIERLRGGTRRTCAIFESRALYHAVSHALKSATEKDGDMFYWKKGTLNWSKAGIDVEGQSLEVEDFRGPQILTWLNFEFLKRAMRAMHGEYVLVEICGVQGPLIFRTGDGFTYLQMPLTGKKDAG